MSLEFDKKEITWIIVAIIVFTFIVIFPLANPKIELLFIPAIIIIIQLCGLLTLQATALASINLT